MPAVIMIWERETVIACCNESCYTSKTPDCFCICRGVNHGVGREEAELNTAIYGISWIASAVTRAKLNPWTLTAQILGFEASVPAACLEG